MKWSDSQRAQLLQIYKDKITQLGEEEFFNQFDSIREEAHEKIEGQAQQVTEHNSDDLLHLEDGRSFPQYPIGTALSWEPEITPRDEEEGYPRLRTVLQALSTYYPERLEAIRCDCLKGYGDRTFGHQSIKLLKLIERFVPGLKQFPSELKPLDSLDYIDPIHASSAASTLGRLGGKVKSETKTLSSRSNGKKGGRPSVKQLDLEEI